MSLDPTASRSLRRALAAVRRAAVVVLMALPLAPPAAVAATLRPELKLEARYDDNVHTAPHGEDDLVRVIAPGLRAEGLGPQLEWRAHARRSVIAYSRSTGAPTSTTDAVSLRAEHRWREHENVRLHGELRRSRDDLDPDEERTTFVPGNYKSGVGTVTVRSARVEGYVRLASWDYDRRGQSDATSTHALATLLPMNTRTHDWLFSYRAVDLHLDGRSTVRSHAGLAGYRRRHTSEIASRIEAGVASVDHDDGSAVTRGAFTAALTLYRAGTGTPRAEARVERDAATTFQVEARRGIASGFAFVRYRRRLEAGGGFDTYPVLANALSISIVDSLGGETVVSLEAAHVRTRPYRGSGSGSRGYRGGVFVTTPVHRLVTGRLGYDFSRQTHRDRPDPLNFRRSRIILSLTAQMK